MQVRETPPFAPVLMESTRAIGYSWKLPLLILSITALRQKPEKFS